MKDIALNQQAEFFLEQNVYKGLKNDPHVKDFYLKGTPLLHHTRHMGIGTDSILFAATLDFSNTETLLDIGTGCGILSIMAHLKNPKTQITAIEPNDLACALAQHNFNVMKNAGKISLIQTDLQTFAKNNQNRFSHIISNPPYFNYGSSHPADYRFEARSTSSLGMNHLLKFIPPLLAPGGKFSLIYPAVEGELLMQQFYANGCFLHKLSKIYNTQNTKPIRYIMEWKQGSGFTTVNQMYLNEKQHGRRYHPLLAEWLTD